MWIQRRIVPFVVATMCLVSGCSVNGLADLPLPAPGVAADAYTITAIFVNALNLPDHAKVKLGGADIGQVASMTAVNYSAAVTMRIQPGVELPVGSTADLRTATLLGDVFVSLKPPDHVGTRQMLRDGDIIGIEHTASAATVEGVLASAAVVVNGGAISNLTTMLNGIGKASGANGHAFGNLVRQSNQVLKKLNARSSHIDAALSNTSDMAAVLETRHDAINELLVAAGPATRHSPIILHS